MATGNEKPILESDNKNGAPAKNYAETYAELVDAGQKVGLTGARLQAFVNSRIDAIDRKEEQKQKLMADVEIKRLELEIENNRVLAEERKGNKEHNFLLEKEKLQNERECRLRELDLKSKECLQSQIVRPHF